MATNLDLAMAHTISPLPCCCYLVGAGPGDPRLITARGLDLLRRADAILYDSLVNPILIIECRKDALLENVGKRYGKPSASQDSIINRIKELLSQGNSVVRLKGGDPMTFARGGEELEAFATAGFPYEIVPGVSALSGATAYAGIPLTHRDFNSEFHAYTATKDTGANDFSALAKLSGTRVLFMGVSQLQKCCDDMLANCADPTTNVAIIEWGTRGKQRCITGNISNIFDIAISRKISQPALIVFGDTVSLRTSLAWWEKKPLWGKKILLTASVTESSRDLVYQLIDNGAEVHWVPLLTLQPVSQISNFEEVVELHQQPDTQLLFNSASAVDFYVRFLNSKTYDIRIFAKNKIIACGSPTQQALRSLGIIPDQTFPAGQLDSVGSQITHQTGTVVWPCSTESRKEWLPHLSERLLPLPVYSNNPRNLAEAERESLMQKWDYALFMSPSAVKSWVSNSIEPTLCSCSVGIGNRTEAELHRAGFQGIIKPQNASAKALLEKLVLDQNPCSAAS